MEPGASPVEARARPPPPIRRPGVRWGRYVIEGAPSMTTGTAQYFDDLGRRGVEPLLKRVSATVRFDIADGERPEHRLVRIDHGDLRVSAEDEPADCVIGADL